MDPRNIRVAFIGCGGFAGRHGRHMSDIADVTIVGLCDVSEASLTSFCDRVGGLDDMPRYDDHQKLLDDVKPDAVVICTPHTLHCGHIVSSLEAGAHVLCQKPMVCTRAEARRVIAAADRADRRVMISYQRHLIGQYLYAKQVLEAGQLGAVRYVTCRLAQDWIQLADRKPRPWRLDPKLAGGGQLMDSGSHMLDCMLWLIDLELDEVYAYQDNCGFEVDVQTAAACRFANGALGTIAVLGDARGRGFMVYDDINIFCERGELLLRNDAVMRRDGQADYYPIADEGLPDTVEPDLAFVQLITGNRKTNPAPPQCGLRMAELAETIYRSAELGRPVKVGELQD